MTPNILMENESKRQAIPLRLLLCFALFVTWQMGSIYFSGTSLSVDGRTPLPVDVGSVTLLIAAGYLLSIVFMSTLPRYIVWAERISALTALASALGLFLPLPPDALTGLLYVQFFCCVFMIGLENAIIVYLFTEKSAIWHLLVAYPAAEILVAALQNDFIKVPFSFFRVFTVIALALMSVFFFKLPGNSWPRFAKKRDGLICPKRFYTGTYLLVFLSSLLTLFGSALSETVAHGVFAYYLAASAYGLLVFFLWKRFDVSPMRSITGLMAVAALGFAMALASLFVPALGLPACVLLAAGTAVLAMSPLLGLLMARQYPSRWISPVIIALALVAVLIQSSLLEALRDVPAALHTVYLVLAVAAVLLYLVLEPYLIYSFRRGAPPEVSASPEFQDAGDTPQPPEPAGGVGSAASIGGEDVVPAAAIAPDTAQVLSACAYDALSGQEQRLAELIMQGYINKEIAGLLNISENTVKYYRKNLYSKLQIHSKRELFELAKRK